MVEPTKNFFSISFSGKDAVKNIILLLSVKLHHNYMARMKVGFYVKQYITFTFMLSAIKFLLLQNMKENYTFIQRYKN